MKRKIVILLGCLLPGWLPAQQDIPLLRPEEREAVDAQANEFNKALEPILATAAKSTVRVWSGKRRLAYGTVIGDGRQVLTKYSELSRARGDLVVESGDGKARAAQVTGVYQADDLAVLTIDGEPLPPVQWFNESPKLGSFLTAVQPGGKPAAFGVVSVLQRNLRETDKAYLGVLGEIGYRGPGVKVQEVKEDSGAAAADLRAGDLIMKVNGRAISGSLELRNAISGLEPGAKVTMEVTRNDREMTLDIVLGNRPNLPQFPGARLQAMEQMGTKTSLVRNSFSNVIQSDMRPNPDQIGGPVVDLQGRVIGITMARADRTRSFVMPSEAVRGLIATKPLDPALAKSAPLEQPGAMTLPLRQRGQMPPGIVPADPDRLRRHVEDMQRLMDRMREEMEQLEELRR
jgi:serine protease Do